MTEIILIVALSIATVVFFILFFAERAKRNKMHNSIRQNPETGNIKASGAFSAPSADLVRYLKLKNCDQLIPELLKELKDDGRLSKLGFYIKPEAPDKPVMSITFNIKDETDNIISLIFFYRRFT